MKKINKEILLKDDIVINDDNLLSNYIVLDNDIEKELYKYLKNDLHITNRELYWIFNKLTIEQISNFKHIITNSEVKLFGSELPNLKVKLYDSVLQRALFLEYANDTSMDSINNKIFNIYRRVSYSDLYDIRYVLEKEGVIKIIKEPIYEKTFLGKKKIIDYKENIEVLDEDKLSILRLPGSSLCCSDIFLNYKLKVLIDISTNTINIIKIN